MASGARRPNVRVDADGVRVESGGVRGGVWLIAVGLAVLALALFWMVQRRAPSAPDLAAAPPAPPVRAARGGETEPARPPAHDGRVERPAIPARRLDIVARPLPRPGAPADGGADDAGDAAAAAAAGDAPSGIQLFPPPGTDPPKPGIIVPDDFDLPPGYVRHYQATDDGQRLPAILMFHPDYEWVDARGERVPLPADLVVPPDMAPPGLEIRMLEVPDTHIPAVEPPPQDAAP